MDFDELLDKYIDQENLYRTEGRRGLEALCQIVGALGYKDPMNFGQMTNKACVGDLICFLEDNSGAIEAIHEWIRDREIPEWKESLSEVVQGDEKAVDHYEGGICPDCGEEINPESRNGDECDNCGHTFTWNEV